MVTLETAVQQGSGQSTRIEWNSWWTVTPAKARENGSLPVHFQMKASHRELVFLYSFPVRPIRRAFDNPS